MGVQRILRSLIGEVGGGDKPVLEKWLGGGSKKVKGKMGGGAKDKGKVGGVRKKWWGEQKLWGKRIRTL